jgi:hypothetical protein
MLLPSLCIIINLIIRFQVPILYNSRRYNDYEGRNGNRLETGVLEVIIYLFILTANGVLSVVVQ